MNLSHLQIYINQTKFIPKNHLFLIDQYDNLLNNEGHYMKKDKEVID